MPTLSRGHGLPLTNPALRALTGPHADLAELHGRAMRYQPDVSPIAALPDDPTAADWADAAALVGAGGTIFLPFVEVYPPANWTRTLSLAGFRMIDAQLASAPDEEAVELDVSDVPEMLDLVSRTEPGPFLARTIDMGRYLGIRHDGRLVAMAGERLQLPGYTEISAVCTDPSYRGQGLAGRLIRAVAHGIHRRGESAFLHVADTNTNAIRLYEALGFDVQARVKFEVYRTAG